jgi:hypothetical protein
MAWTLEGTYFENCSCTAVCPCTWSGTTWPATSDRCNAMLAFHIDRGDIEGVDVSGLSFGMVLDTPKLMAEGNWRVGVLMDAGASAHQAGKLGAVLGGELGGPPAMLAPLIGEMMGVESVDIDYREDGRRHQVRFGDLVDMEVEDFVADDFEEPVRLTGVFHPAATTLTVAPATRSRVAAFGVEFDGTGTSGFSAPFAWAG